jgi:hypothetical protein
MWTVHTSAAGPLLFGQIGRLEWDLILPVGALIGVVALGIWAIFKVKKWRQEEAEVVGPTLQEQLDHYQKMVDEGMLDPEELARIKAQLDKKPTATEPANEQTPPAAGQPPDTSIRET